MKGIILAGGSGSRLYPLTNAVSKQILPLYDKPMIYYPLSCLMLANIRDVLIISTPRDLHLFKELFGDGKWLGMNFEYAVQESPGGLAQAFIIGEDFIKDDDVALVLGDNIFFGQGFTKILTNARSKIEEKRSSAVIFGYKVKNPSSYGVADFDKNGKVLNIEEKPSCPKSSYAVPGLYFYNNQVVEFAKKLHPSQRGEVEITDLNNIYIKNNSLSLEILGRGMAWLDTGTYDSLLEASNFIATIEKRQGMYVSCIEEIAFSKSWITREELLALASRYPTEYGAYLKYISQKQEEKNVL